MASMTRIQEIVATIANAKNRLFLALKKLPLYGADCTCANEDAADTFHEYGDGYEICLTCGGRINTI